MRPARPLFWLRALGAAGESLPQPPASFPEQSFDEIAGQGDGESDGLVFSLAWWAAETKAQRLQSPLCLLVREEDME